LCHHLFTAGRSGHNGSKARPQEAIARLFILNQQPSLVKRKPLRVFWQRESSKYIISSFGINEVFNEILRLCVVSENIYEEIGKNKAKIIDIEASPQGTLMSNSLE
jgi:hypothetical protein